MKLCARKPTACFLRLPSRQRESQPARPVQATAAAAAAQPPSRGGADAPLAGLVEASGAEWSLFCPGMGIALDSWLRLIARLVRPAAGSGLAWVAGVTTVSAGGTDGSGVPEADERDSIGSKLTVGAGGVDGFLSQATSPVMARARTTAVSEVRMGFFRVGVC